MKKFTLGLLLGLALSAHAKEVADYRFVYCIRYLASAYAEVLEGLKVEASLPAHQGLDSRSQTHFVMAHFYRKGAQGYWDGLVADYGHVLSQQPLAGDKR